MYAGLQLNVGNLSRFLGGSIGPFAPINNPTFTGTVTINASTSGSPSLTQAVVTQQYATGVSAGPISLNHFKIWSDNIDAGNGGGSDFFVEGFTHEHYFGGANARGGRQAITAYLYLTATTSPLNDNGNYVAIAGVATALATDGGTGTSLAASKGAMFGLGTVGHLKTGAINFINVTAAEFNVVVETGASVHQKTIIQLSARSDDRVKGVGTDAMILASNQDVLNPKWDYGILFDYEGLASAFPFGAGSTVLATRIGTIGIGIDFSGTTIATAAFKSPGFLVLPDGSVTALNIGAVGSIGAGATAPIYFDTRSQIVSPLDGLLQLRNAAATGFTQLQLGGGTVAFPSLVVSGDHLQVKFADNSGFSTLDAGQIIARGSISDAPTSGDARLFGSAPTGADRVRYEAHIPAVVAWYWGSDSTGKWKLAANSSSFATPAITVDQATSAFALGGSLSRGAPVTKTGDFTVAATENWLINNKAGSSCVVTLPSAATFGGREIMFLNYQAFSIDSASSNVKPISGGALGITICSASAGSWAILVSDGTNWIKTAGG